MMFFFLFSNTISIVYNKIIFAFVALLLSDKLIFLLNRFTYREELKWIANIKKKKQGFFFKSENIIFTVGYFSTKNVLNSFK